MSLAGLQVGGAGGGDPAPFTSFWQESKETIEELNTEKFMLAFFLTSTKPLPIIWKGKHSPAIQC